MAVFSSITIEFLIDFEEDYQLGITFNDNDTISSQLYTWVASRSNPFEVTTGVPTGTAGETTTINFESAFDLDNPSDFITTQTTNSIKIQSEVLGFDFIGIRCLDENGDGLFLGSAFNVTFENYTVPIDTTNVDIGLVRSPHYINLPFDFETTTSVTVDVKIWGGDLASVPVDVTYSLTNPRPSSNFDEFNMDISKIIKENLNPRPVIDLTSSSQLVDSSDESVKWVEYVASYTDTDEAITEITNTLSAIEGYGLYLEGVNPTTPDNDWLSDSLRRNVDRTGFIIIPFANKGNITSITVLSNGAEINDTLPVTSSNLSTEFVQYVCVDVSQTTNDTSITISDGTTSFVFDIIDECRYTPISMVFKNRYGAFESFTMFKKAVNSISVDKDKFVNNYISSGTYDTSIHQIRDINIEATESLKINSGYISENENELYKQMLVSNQIFIYDSQFIPIRIQTTSLEFKTRVNDTLVNYNVDFQYAYNYIQDV